MTKPLSPVAHAGRIALAAKKRAEAEARLEIAIRDAHASGMSLRTIAESAGVSHETVRRALLPFDKETQ